MWCLRFVTSTLCAATFCISYVNWRLRDATSCSTTPAPIFGMKSTEFPRDEVYRYFARSEIYILLEVKSTRVEIYRILLGVKSTEFRRGEFHTKIPQGEIYRISSWWNLQNFFALPSPLPGDSGWFVGIFLLKRWRPRWIRIADDTGTVLFS